MGSSSNKKYYHEKKENPCPMGISDEQMEIILPQMKKSICKIKCKNGGTGTGFLCLIPYPTKLKQLPVLITNNHVLSESDIEKNQTIEFSMNKGNIKYEIFIDDLRKTYTSEEYDTTIVEIKESDKLDINSFLEIDYDIYEKRPNEKYEKKSFYLLHCSNEVVIYSIGVIKYIDEKYNINHICNSEEGSSGGPILNLINYKVIGIHKGGKEGKNINVGALIKLPIDEFNEKNKETEIKDNLIVKDDDTDEITIVYQNRKIEKIDEGIITFIKEKLGEEVSKNKIFGEKFVKKIRIDVK